MLAELMPVCGCCCRNLSLLDQLSLPDLHAMPDLGHLSNLNSAVAMLHEREVGDIATLQQRRSSVLLYVDNRLGAPEGQLINARGSGRGPMQIDAPGHAHLQGRWCMLMWG